MICIKLLKAQSDQTKVRYAEGCYITSTPWYRIEAQKAPQLMRDVFPKASVCRLDSSCLPPRWIPAIQLGCENKLPITSITLPNQGRVPLWSTLKMLLARCFEMNNLAGLP